MTHKKVVFLHPDLGIGGAERLAVDAALALKEKGHAIHFITTHHDPSHCFVETKNGEIPVTVICDWLPRNIFGKFFALCAYIRMIFAAFYLIFFSGLNPDVVFCDIISVCIPILHLRVKYVIFYCHFPDQLLSQPGSLLKSIYRAPLNWLEERTTGCADKILVNSSFTRKVFKDTFLTIHQTPDILYPSINTNFFDNFDETKYIDLIPSRSPNSFLFLSINRYERKKKISLAIEAFNELRTLLLDSEWTCVTLVIAGGYDSRVLENIEYFGELKNIADKFKIDDKIKFFKSPSDMEKLFLLKTCDCLIYTPPNEHFGIVPIEAMYSEKPVIAVNSGGPTETVVNGETGFLCEPNKDEFSLAMSKCIKDKLLREKMGKAGKDRFVEKFSFKAFTDQLNNIVDNLSNKKNY